MHIWRDARSHLKVLRMWASLRLKSQCWRGKLEQKKKRNMLEKWVFELCFGEIVCCVRKIHEYPLLVNWSQQRFASKGCTFMRARLAALMRNVFMRRVIRRWPNSCASFVAESDTLISIDDPEMILCWTCLSREKHGSLGWALMGGLIRLNHTKNVFQKQAGHSTVKHGVFSDKMTTLMSAHAVFLACTFAAQSCVATAIENLQRGFARTKHIFVTKISHKHEMPICTHAEHCCTFDDIARLTSEDLFQSYLLGPGQAGRIYRGRFNVPRCSD